MKKWTITVKKVDKFLEFIEGGVSFRGACGGAGVSRDTMRSWLERGREQVEGDGIEAPERVLALLTRLFTSYKDLLAKLEKDLVASVRRAADGGMRGDWRAAAFLLERRYQQDWSQRVQEAKSEAVGLVLEALRDVVSAKDYDKVRRRLARAVRG